MLRKLTCYNIDDLRAKRSAYAGKAREVQMHLDGLFLIVDDPDLIDPIEEIKGLKGRIQALEVLTGIQPGPHGPPGGKPSGPGRFHPYQ